MDGKRLFLLLFISMISFSNAELQHQTLFINEDDARLTLSQTLYQTAASHPGLQPSAKILSMEMVHRDHLPTAANKKNSRSRSKMFPNRLKRDRTRVTSLSNRATHPSPTPNGTVISGYSKGTGEYFTILGVGTPPKFLYMILDTGSDVTWLQCRPCKTCYKQIGPIFKPKSSKTYRKLSCDSKPCKLLSPQLCTNTSKICKYEVWYGDGSLTTGDFSTETLTLGNNSLAGIAIGCGYYNKGMFRAAAGLVGLGGGKLSFPNQLANQQYRNQFSYCLVSRGSKVNSSSITFGETAVSKKTRYTPMITNNASGMDTFYYVNLTGISVGGVPVKGVTSAISMIDPNGDGGVIIDSGTAVTHLEKSAFIALRDAFRNATKKFKLVPPPAELAGYMDTCYDFSGLKNVSVPTVVLRFDGGVKMALPSDNCLFPIDDVGKLFCFAFMPMKGMSIIGNTQQQGFRVTYDLMGKRIGFVSRSC